MALSLRDLYPNDLSYIKDQVDWLYHIWSQRPLCSHQEHQAKLLKEELITRHPEETGLIGTLNQVLGEDAGLDIEDLDLF